MIKAYFYLFYTIYGFFKKIEAGYLNQTDDARAFRVIAIISFMQMLNVFSFFKYMEKPIIFFLLALFLLSNYIVFLKGNRYKKMASTYPLPNMKHKIWVSTYVIITILLFTVAVNNDFPR